MRTIVTGGAGFIGSHLVDRLIADGHHVIVIDNLSTGKREYVHPQAEFHHLNLQDKDAIAPLFKNVDLVFHVGAQVRMQPSIANPESFFDSNVRGTLNVLLASRDNNIQRVVYSASSSAYGPQDVRPLHEDLMPNPKNPYAVFKHCGELKMRLFAEVYGLPTVSLRYFNVYGPRQAHEGDYSPVIGKFLRQKKVGEPLTIVHDGTYRRAFTHVRDVVEANMLAALSPQVGKGEIINVGISGNTSVLELAAMIGGPTVFIEPRIGEVRETLADITRARNLLGWEPKISLEEGIAELKKLEGVE